MEVTALEKSVSLELELLEILKQEAEWRTIEDLSGLLGTSFKKTVSLVNNISEKIEEFNSEQLILKTMRGRGNLLVIGNVKEYRKFRREIVEEILIYKLIFSVVLEENTSLERLSLENYVSESLIKKKISKANKFLDNWGVKIVTRKKECIFLGEEPQIRVMLNTLFWRLYRGEEWPFFQIDQALIKKIIHKLATSLNIELSEVTYHKLAYIFAINYSRFSLGKKVELSNDLKKYSQLCTWIDSQTSIYSILKFEYGLTKDEINFFILEIMTQSGVYSNISNNIFKFEELVKDTPAYSSLQLILEKFNEYLGELSEEQYISFFKNIFPCHLYADLFSGIFFTESAYYSLNIISQYIPKMKKSLEEIISSLYIESELKLFLNTDYLITEYILVLSQYIPIAFKEKEIKILVDTDASDVSEKFLIKQIQNRFSTLYNIKLITQLKEKQKGVDFVVTTNTLNDYKMLGEDIQVFVIQLFPTQKDLNDIEDYISFLNKKI